MIAGTVCFFLSMLSKETVITFIGIIPLVFFFFINGDKKRSAYVSICALLAAVVCIAIRFSVLNFYHANEIATINFIDNALAKPDVAFDSRIATAIYILGLYLKLLFVPYPLHCDYSFNSIGFAQFSDPIVLLSLAAYAFLIFFGIKRFLKNNKDPYAFSIFFFLITLSLFSNIPFLIGTTMGERLLFFPSVGFCLAAGLAIEMAGKTAGKGIDILKSPKILAIIIPVLLIYAGLTITRNNDWVDDITLFRTDAEKAPNDSKLHYDVGHITLSAGYAEKDGAARKQQIAESISNLAQAVDIYPDYTLAQIDLCWAYYLAGKYDSAEMHGQAAVRLAPSNTIAINNLAAIYNTRKKFPEAIALFKKVLQLSPANEGTAFDLGDAYFSAAQYDSAEVYLQASLKQNPKNSGAVNDLAGIYFFRKDFANAIGMYKNAVELNPKYVKPYSNIGVCYLYLNKYDSAIGYTRKAIEIDPAFTSSYEVLAAIYHNANKMDSARKYEAIAQKDNRQFKL